MRRHAQMLNLQIAPKPINFTKVTKNRILCLNLPQKTNSPQKNSSAAQMLKRLVKMA